LPATPPEEVLREDKAPAAAAEAEETETEQEEAMGPDAPQPKLFLAILTA